MSKAHLSDGRRRSSMTHARRGHQCGLCERVSFGNGGQVAHGRSHVRRGEAVELLKEYPTYPPISSRLFLAPDDERVAKYLTDGFRKIESRAAPARPAER